MRRQQRTTLLVALRHVVEARGGLSELAQHTALDRAGLYRALSSKSNPSLATLQAIVDALGLRLVFKLKGDNERKSLSAKRPEKRADTLREICEQAYQLRDAERA